ncbi:MAG TPA: PIN domain-containing protein [Gemmatimonadaceae bacterium]|nr:PIN domain-containing protein [Gemmatimonadaceae bacterium]
MPELLALDTNVYITAIRSADRLAQLKGFLIRAGLKIRVPAIVALELRAGARTGVQRSAVEDLLAAYVARDRVIVPSFAAYVESGRVLAELALREGVELSRASSLVNDVLLAASCREAGARLITYNAGDFAAVQRYLRGFRFTAADEAL